VTAKGSRRPGPLRGGGQAAAEVGKAKSYAHPQGAGDAQSSTSAPVPANDDGLPEEVSRQPPPGREA